MTAILRRAAGWARTIAWVLLLATVALPWRELGGVVDERLRWLERVACAGPAPIGFTLGRIARDRAAADGTTYARAARGLALPAALATAVALIALKLARADDAVGIVVTAWLSFQAGADVALGALPLMEGKSPRIEPPALSGSLPRSPARRPLPGRRVEDRVVPGSRPG